MNYDEELEYLKRGLKKITDKFHQAVAEGHEMYAEMWKEEIVDIEHRIHVYEQASKADEYEAKARAFDRIVEQRKETGVITLGHHAWHIIQKYESGEYDAKK